MLIAVWACIVAPASLAVEALASISADSNVVPDFGEAERDSHVRRPLKLPQVTLADLAENLPATVVAARTALSELGALVVVGGEDSSTALQAWAECLQSGGAARRDETVAQRPLAEGFVRRSSVFAKERWGDSPAARFASCPAAAGYEEVMRLGVRTATRTLAMALETNSGDVDGDVSLKRAILEGEHLEHLHLYEEARNRDRRFGEHRALEMHTDAGALLAFVPPVAAGSGQSPFLELEGADGIRYDLAAFPTNSVVFFVGQASRLLSRSTSPSPFRPVPHALSLPLGFAWRAWYGVMILIPHDAVVHPDPTVPKRAISFGTLWEGARSHVIEKLGNGSASLAHEAPIGCGAGLVLVDQAGNCPEGTIACWMQCMSIKGELETCKNDIWAASGLGDMATKAPLKPQCREPHTGKKYPEETGNMCPSCKPVCTIGVNASMPMPSPSPGAEDNGFCNSQGIDVGTIMYMDGFRWTAFEPSAACLALFFGSWIIDAPWKLILTCIIVAMLGVLMEMVSLTRRYLPPNRQRDVGYVFHGMNLCLAYLVMLVIMMYSIELFLSVLIGLVIGHVVSTTVARRVVAKRQVQNPASRRDTLNDCLCPSEIVPDHGAHSACCRMALGLDAPFLQSLTPSNSLVQIAEGYAYLDVKGMTCISCSTTVKRALLSIVGVVSVEVSLETNVARVGFNSPANAAQMCEAVEIVGFEAAERVQIHSEEPPST